MEYIIANKRFPNAQMIDDGLWVQGKFSNCGPLTSIIEGWVVDKNLSMNECLFGDLTKNTPEGAFNLIQYNSQTKEIIVKNDKNGTFQLFFYSHKGNFGISNNLWLLISLFKEDITINLNSVKSRILTYTQVIPGETFFSQISFLTYASILRYNIQSNIIKIHKYWDFQYHPKYVTENDLLEKVDTDFIYLFQQIKKQNPNQIAGIGCSGGLDSRIIMHYLDKAGIERTPYVYCEKKPNLFFDSSTVITSREVAALYGNTVKVIEYDPNLIPESMFLDIRNNPLGPSQLCINDVRNLPQFDYMLCGDPGGLCYLPIPISINSFEQLRNHSLQWFSNAQISYTGSNDILNKAKKLFFPSKQISEACINSMYKSPLFQILNFSHKEIEEALDSTILNLKGNTTLETWYRIVIALTAPCQYYGGYESISGTKRSYFSYLPYWLDLMQELPEEYLINKKLLKSIIKYINPELSQIRDQLLGEIGATKIKNIKNKIEYVLRGRGLNTINLMKSDVYKEYVEKILSVENPVFYDLISKENLINSGIVYSLMGPNLIKIKMVLDVFISGNLSEYIAQGKFSKAEW